MGRHKTGTFYRSPDGTELRVRISVEDDLGRTHRPWFNLDPRTSDANARKIAAQLTKEADGQPWDPKRFEQVQVLGKAPTVSQYVTKVWLPSRDGKIKSLRSDKSRWKNHIEPLIGHLRMAEVTQAHMRRVVEELDDKADNSDGVGGRDFGEKTAVNCWAVVKAIFRDACSAKKAEIRVLDGRPNPCVGVLPPDGPGEIEKQWLFPSELRQLLECQEVALYRRWVYACAVYLFCRPGEVLALLWGAGIDTTHWLARINRAWNSEKRVFNEYTKTGDTRHFAIEPILRPVLSGIKAASLPDSTLVFPDRFHLAAQLRADLLTAGVRREALHVKRKGARVMRFHDLRATGITYLALRGDSDNTVRDRAGHDDFKTTQEYIRRGQHAAGADIGDPFAALPTQLLGLPAVISSGLSVSGGGGLGKNRPDPLLPTGDGLPSGRVEGAEGGPDPASIQQTGAVSLLLDEVGDDKKTLSGDPEASAFEEALAEHQGANPPRGPVSPDGGARG